MSLLIALTDEEWAALEAILVFEEKRIQKVRALPTMSTYSNRWTERVRLVRERLDAAVEEQARDRAFREHVHELSEREFQGGGPR